MSYINDGHGTIYSFSLEPSVLFKEKAVTPPGLQGGGPNDTTTMRNIRYRTRQPKKLLTMSESKLTASYDPEVYDAIVDMMQVNQEITITWPNGASLTFWGWLDDFTPGEMVEGAQPTAEVTIIPSNQDDADTEAAPTYTPAP